MSELHAILEKSQESTSAKENAFKEMKKQLWPVHVRANLEQGIKPAEPDKELLDYHARKVSGFSATLKAVEVLTQAKLIETIRRTVKNDKPISGIKGLKGTKIVCFRLKKGLNPEKILEMLKEKSET